MIEPLAQQFIADSIMHSLDIPESLAQSMSPVVPSKVNLPAPVFYHAIGMFYRDGLYAFSALEVDVRVV